MISDPLIVLSVFTPIPVGGARLQLLTVIRTYKNGVWNGYVSSDGAEHYSCSKGDCERWYNGR